MSEMLSPYRLNKARDLYNLFNVFNSLSWTFLVGNVIVLLSLRLGANSTFIGTLSAVLYVSFFFVPVGKILARRFSVVKIFGYAWIGRALVMTPVLFAPFVFSSGNSEAALLLILLGVSLFHVVRGIGIIGNNPVLNMLASGPDRGAYMTQAQIINSAVGMFAGFVIALLLGRDPPIFLYALIIAVGIGTGIFSGILMNKIPTPLAEENGGNKKLSAIFREAMTQPSLRVFFIILILVALVSGVCRTFLVVYSREVLDQSDGMVSLYAVFGGLGVLMVGIIIKFLVDKIGAKPIFSVCVIIGLVSMIPVLFFPASMKDNFTTVALYLTFLFFMMNLGWLGTEGVMNTYFLGMVPQDEMMDMSMIYFFCFGMSGAAGSLLSGMFLDAAMAISGSAALAFRILYAVLIALSAAILFFTRKLIPLGALPFMGALEVMFSYRDLKAISLLDKLNKTSDFSEETAILGALHGAPSKIAIKGLLGRIKSPRLSVRMESIRAIDALPALNEDAERALMDDIIHNPYTTAYRSARVLGNHGVFAATPLLRELAVSSDYMLAGEAIIALAKLKDSAFKEHIEHLIEGTHNPRLKIAGVEALGIYGHEDSLPVLLDVLRAPNPPPYLKDEVSLAMANILGTHTRFYPLLVRFLADPSLIATLAIDEADAAFEYYMTVLGRKRNKSPLVAYLDDEAVLLQPAVSGYVRGTDGRALYRWIMDIPEELVHDVVQTVLSEAVVDGELNSYPHLRLLISHWAANILRQRTDRLRE